MPERIGSRGTTQRPVKGILGIFPLHAGKNKQLQQQQQQRDARFAQIGKSVWPDHPDSIRSIAGHRLHAKPFPLLRDPTAQESVIATKTPDVAVMSSTISRSHQSLPKNEINTSPGPSPLVNLITLTVLRLPRPPYYEHHTRYRRTSLSGHRSPSSRPSLPELIHTAS